jgi:putative hydrolase of the HAD superfamily
MVGGTVSLAAAVAIVAYNNRTAECSSWFGSKRNRDLLQKQPQQPLFVRDLGGPIRLRGVTFDLDDTLWDCHTVLDRAHKIRYERVRTDFPALCARWPTMDAFKKQLRAEQKAAKELDPSIAHSYTEMHKRALAAMATECGLSPASVVEPLFMAFSRERSGGDEQLFLAVPAMLIGLVKGHGLVAGACTNGNANALLVPTLSKYFSFALSAVEAKTSKPDPAIFHQAWALSGLKAVGPGKWVHVGDNLAEDCGGARAAGGAAT